MYVYFLLTICHQKMGNLYCQQSVLNHLGRKTVAILFLFPLLKSTNVVALIFFSPIQKSNRVQTLTTLLVTSGVKKTVPIT